MGSTDSWSVRFSQHDVHSAAAAVLDLRRTSEEGAGGGGALQCKHVTLHNTSALLRLGTQSTPQVAQSVQRWR